jgi:hypothetical protein
MALFMRDVCEFDVIEVRIPAVIEKFYSLSARKTSESLRKAWGLQGSTRTLPLKVFSPILSEQKKEEERS